MARHNEIGRVGEHKAQQFLLNLGYTIVETNWRDRKFEIDIIAMDGDELVFVEVKTRSSSIYGEPEESITPKKQLHLIDGANHYINENEIDLECRFDVISIVVRNNASIKHFKYAFYP